MIPEAASPDEIHEAQRERNEQHRERDVGEQDREVHGPCRSLAGEFMDAREHDAGHVEDQEEGRGGESGQHRPAVPVQRLPPHEVEPREERHGAGRVQARVDARACPRSECDPPDAQAAWVCEARVGVPAATRVSVAKCTRAVSRVAAPSVWKETGITPSTVSTDRKPSDTWATARPAASSATVRTAAVVPWRAPPDREPHDRYEREHPDQPVPEVENNGSVHEWRNEAAETEWGVRTCHARVRVAHEPTDHRLDKDQGSYCHGETW